MTSAAKSQHSARVAQTSADARLHAAYEGSEDAGAGRSGVSFDYAKSGLPTSSRTDVAPEAITAYLQRMQRGGLTQAFGCMLAVAGHTVLALSENAPDMLETGVGLGTDLRILFTQRSTAALEQAAKVDDLSGVNPLVVQSCNGSGKQFYAVLHRVEDVKGLVIDLEPIEDLVLEEKSSVEMAVKPIAQILSLPGGDIGQLCQAVVEEVQEMTGYDRVMAYKFHEDQHGEVVAEIRRPHLEPYLGLHYPSTDVPQASRMMFMKNGVRMIGDCARPPVRVVQNKELAQPISLAGSSLRAPHGCHAQYMRNMGSAASLTMAVVIDDYDDDSSLSGSRKLWGLVVCHHTTPRTVSYPVRSACSNLMEVFGVELNKELDLATQLRENHILSTQTMLCDLLRRIRGAPIGIVSSSPSIMDLVKCDGAALYYGGKLWLLGITPMEFQIQDLAEWLLGTSDEIASTGVTCTDSLAEAGYPSAAALGDAVCGLAAARISPNSDFLFWFRSHTAKEVFWGGAEHDPLARDDDSRMQPRSSFNAFLEIVKKRCLPWEEIDVDAIRSLQLILREELEKFCAAAAAAAAAPAAVSASDEDDVDSLVPSSKKLSLKESQAMGEMERGRGPAAGGAAGGRGGGWGKLSLPANLLQEWMEAVRGAGDGGTSGGGGGGDFNWDPITVFEQTSFVVVDAVKPDLPIIFASRGFFELTGYTAREVIGRNCRFLQGPDTDPADVASIREALARGTGTFCGRLLNCRKDGSSFWNLLTIAPIKDDMGSIVKLIGVQLEVSKYTEGSRGNRLRPNGLPQSLIKYDARHQDKVSVFVGELVAALTKPDKVEPVRPSSAMQLSLTGQTIQPLSQPLSQILAMGKDGKGRRRRRSNTILSLLGMEKKDSMEDQLLEPELIMVDEQSVGWPESLDDPERTRRGIDLATTLERIGQSFVISDPRLPDNPIIFASDQFLELTEYSREEVLGINCRFLQGRDTDRKAVQLIRNAILERRNVTVQLLNYTRGGRPFWNLLHLQAMWDKKGDLQYYIGVMQETAAPRAQEDMPDRVDQMQVTAQKVDLAARELPDTNVTTPDHLWMRHSKAVTPLPHSKASSSSWYSIRRVQRRFPLGLKHFRPIKPLGSGDTGSVHLVELRGTGHLFALKAMDKSVMLQRNKVHRATAEREILAMMDHPFLPTLYASFQTKTHVCNITDYCPGGDLFLLQEKQPSKTLSERVSKTIAAEVVVALEYLHCMGVIYRDLKPENVLLQKNGHILLTDFDLSFLTSCRPHLIGANGSRRSKKRRVVFCAEPDISSNSFVGTEEYIAPEIISGQPHSSAVDWWGLGILLYEMLYSRTPFAGRNRQKTFYNVLNKELTFPSSIPVSLAGRQLIAGLLQRDPTRRLGAARGASDIKKHPFFQSITWPLIRWRKVPRTLHNLLNGFGLDEGPDSESDTKPQASWGEERSSRPPSSSTHTFQDTF
uniref:non-specific serine/threonine protein kinase n=1 Tax=Adiantum raddianum TaxID=32168 RepID=A0A059UJ98_ADIRA|nr:neochrome [Adiantum raddianum]